MLRNCRKCGYLFDCLNCPECNRARSKKHYVSNADYYRKYALANPEKEKARKVAYRQANPEKTKAYKLNYRLKNREAMLAYAKKWREANAEKIRVQYHNRRAIMSESGGRLSRGITGRLHKLQRGKCACGCRQLLGDNYHLDHILPLALGGTNTDDNVQLLRATCNLQKHAKHPVDFMQQRGFLL